MRTLHALRRIPWHLVLLVALLVGTGIVFIDSSTRDTRLEGLHRRQLQSVAIALPLFLGILVTPLRTLARGALPCYAVMLVSLVAVFFFGIELNSARRWLAGPAGFLLQPSELCKPVLIVALARYLQFRPPPVRLRDHLGPAALTLVPFLLVRAQPDLGTALLYLPLSAGMLYAAGARRLHYLLGAVLAVLLVPVLVLFLEDYQKERIWSFQQSVPRTAAQIQEALREGDVETAEEKKDLLRDLKQNSAYQSYYALVSVGSGGVRGQGIGRGPQNRLNFLPERHNDFVFAVVGEETGLLGSTLLVALFLLLGFSVFGVAVGTRDRFGQLVCVGVAVALTVQALGNMAMTTGLLPITGMPLPFVSQGGSSMMSSLAMIALVLAVGRCRGDTEPFLYPETQAADPFREQSEEPQRRRLRPR